MKILHLLLFSFIVYTHTIFSQSNKIETTKTFKNKADTLFKYFKYDSASVFYCKAAQLYEQEQEWLPCVMHYRLTGNTLLKAAKYDTASYYAFKALDIADSHFNGSNKDEMFEKADVLISLANVNEKKAKYKEELESCKNALGLILKTDSLAELRMANIWSKTGVAHYNLGKADSALWFGNIALASRIKLLGAEHIDVAESIFYIGKIYLKKGDYDKALEYFQKALTINIAALGEQHPDVANCYNSIGIVYYYKGEYGKVLEYHQKALAIRIAALGEQHPDVATSYNNIGNAYFYKGEYGKTLEYYQKALTMRIKALGEQHLDVAASYNNIGNAYFYKGDYGKTLEYYQKALKVRITALGEQHPDGATSYNNIGNVYYYKGDYGKTLEYYQKALKMRINALGEQHPNVADSYNNIGIVFKKKGDNNKALEYYQKALAIRIKTMGKQHPNVADSYITIGDVYAEKGNNNKALEHFQKALKIKIDALGTQHPDVAIVYNNIGGAYNSKAEYDKALEYFQKALKIKIDALGTQHPGVAMVYNNIGNVYNSKAEYDKALEYYLKDFTINISAFGNLSSAVAYSYNNIGEVYSKKGKTIKALQYYQKALMSNTVGFTDSSIYTNPILTKTLSETVFLRTLAGKANAFYQLSGTKTNSIRDIEASLSTYKLAFQLVNSMRNGYNNEDTKLLLSENTKNYYTQAAHVAMEYAKLSPSQDNIGKAFEFIEKGKSATISGRFNEFDAKHFAGITDTLLEAEKELRTKIGFFNTQIVKEISPKNGYDTLKINTLENEKFTCSRKLDSLITYFENTYPAYYEIKYAKKNATIPEIQKTLNHNTAVLNYFVGDSSLFIAAITDSLYKMEEIPIDSSFKKLVTKYYGDIKNAEPEAFVNNSQRIYQKLMLPVKEYIANKTHLVIIPDDYLYYIPFETLIDNNASSPKITNDDYSKLDYLIKSHSISYHHSATLWYNSKKKESVLAARPKMNFIGFAPVFSKEQNNGLIVSSNISAIDTTGNNLAYRAISSDMKRFNPLPYSKDEVTSIVHLFEKQKKEAKAYIYGEANETNFKNNAGSYSIVHVSSHGFSNDKEPDLSGIVFSQPTDSLTKEDGILYTGETYNLNLHADLIVLSSCESGLGKLIRGEGLQALSRGFLYAGAPNVLFSLWKALDKPTKDLMEQFYSNTLEGKTYAESLRMAKLKLINDPNTAFPHFWSGFVLVGR